MLQPFSLRVKVKFQGHLLLHSPSTASPFAIPQVRFVILIYIFTSLTFLPDEPQKNVHFYLQVQPDWQIRLEKKKKRQNNNTTAKNDFFPLKSHSRSVTCKPEETQVLQSRVRHRNTHRNAKLAAKSTARFASFKYFHSLGIKLAYKMDSFCHSRRFTGKGEWGEVQSLSNCRQ